MGEITKTITIEVPVDVVYHAIKESALSGWWERYCKDLIKSGRLKMFRKLGKVEATYTLRPVGESNCEVTIHSKYRLVLDAQPK